MLAVCCKDRSILPDIRKRQKHLTSIAPLPFIYHIIFFYRCPDLLKKNFVYLHNCLCDLAHFLQQDPYVLILIVYHNTNSAISLATPSSSLEAVKRSAAAFAAGTAFSTATPKPAYCSISKSLLLSPMATTSCRAMPKC